MTKPPTRRNADFAAIAAVILMPAVFFFRILSGRGFLWEDFVTFAWPRQNFLAQCLHRGFVPLWNPHSFSGVPFLDDLQNGVLYPPNMVAALFAPGGHLPFRILEAAAVAHIMLAGFLTFLLLRGLRFRPASSLAGAATFMFSGFMAFHLQHLNLIQTAAWTPLILHHAFRLLRGNTRPLRVACLGGAIGISLLAGFPQVSFFVALAIAIAAAGAWIADIQQRSPRRAIKTALGLAAAAALALALWLPQLLPAAALSRESVRSNWNQVETFENSVAPRDLLTLFAPNWRGYLGDSQQLGRVRLHNGIENYWETHGYAGVMALAGLLAVLLGAGCVRRREDAIFLAFGAFFLALALGGNFILHNVVYSIAPWIYGKFSSPGRALFGVAIAFSYFAARGMEALFESPTANETKPKSNFPALLIAAGILLLVAGIIASFAVPDAWWKTSAVSQERVMSFLTSSLFVIEFGILALFGKLRPSQFWVAIAALLLFVDLFFNHARMNAAPNDDRAASALPPAISKAISPGGEPFRVNIDGRLGKDLPAEVLGVERTGGYNRPFRLSRYNTFLNAAKMNPRLLDALNVRYELHDAATPYFPQPGSPTEQVRNIVSAFPKYPLTLAGLWDFKGFPDFDGIATYEGIFETPKGFIARSPALVSADGVDDTAKIFLNGRFIGGAAVGPFRIPLDPRTLNNAQPNSLAFVVRDLGGGGGFRGPVYLESGGKKLNLDDIVVGAWIFRPFRNPRTFTLEKRPNAAPGVYFAAKTICAPDERTTLGALTRADFDPTQTAILEGCPAPAPQPCGGNATAQIIRRSPNRIDTRTQTNCPATVVFSEIWHPGWKLKIDGRPAQILRADYALRGVIAPKGAHNLTMAYEPPGLRGGMAVAIAALFTALGVAIVGLKNSLD